MPSRRAVLIGATALAGAAPAHATSTGPWAVELFTSQGCSSCPPADAQLGKLARRPDVVALSFHVDYWDYIGWKDPFASQAMTERQKTYARVLHQRYVYTPEMVFDGAAHEPGTERSDVEAMLEAARRRTPNRVTPLLSRSSDGALAIALSDFTLSSGPADIMLAVYDRRHITPVARGENSGATLENHNVVRRLERVAQWNGQAATWSVQSDRIGPGQAVAVLVQQADQGPILGCNKLESAVTG
jgi:hypothetical protein